MNIADFVRVHAERQPDAAALIEDDNEVDWQTLYGRVEATAARLAACGVGPGDRVALALRGRIDNVVLCLAVARAGAAWCNLDWRMRPTERAHFLQQVAPRLLVEDRPQEGTAGAISHADLDRTVARGELSSLPVDADAPAALIMSSGTTGLPKVVSIPHRAAVWRAIANTSKGKLDAGMRVLHVLPLTASAAFSTLMGQLMAGATGVFHPVIFAPDELAENLNALRIEQTTLVPTAMRSLMELSTGSVPLFPRLNALFSLGSIFHPEEKLQALARLTPCLFEGYGSAGSGAATSATPIDIARNPASVGRATVFVQIEIADEDGMALPPGSIGRIRVRSPGAAAGYVGGVLGSSYDEVFRDGWVYPGDFGRLDANGELYVEGRSASRIISGGNNISPEEIERVLLAHPHVAEAAVIGRADARLGEVPIAFLVTRTSTGASELSVHCRTSLQAHKVPVAFHFVGALPRTANGKIHRAALGELDERLSSGSIAADS